MTATSRTAKAAAEKAANSKCAKYTELFAAYEFQPVAVESHEPLSEATVSFLVNPCSKISIRSGETGDPIYLPALQLNLVP